MVMTADLVELVDVKLVEKCKIHSPKKQCEVRAKIKSTKRDIAQREDSVK